MAEFGPRNIVPLLPKREDTGRPVATIIDIEREVPPATPFQEASILEPDVALDGIPIEPPYTYGEADCEGRKQGDPDFEPYFQGLTLPTAGLGLIPRPRQLVGPKPYRQTVVLTSIGTAAQVELVYWMRSPAPVAAPYLPGSDFKLEETLFVGAGDLPFEVRVETGQEVWARQTTLIAQTITFVVRPAAVATVPVGP